ncbi:MAG: DUF1428 domain-containing protein [Phycisphaerae bacterium]
MPKYVDGFVLPIATKNLAAYRRLARLTARVWREHGALEYRECVGEDLKIKDVLSFPTLAKSRPGETVVLAWIVFKSRAHRDRVNKLVLADPRLKKVMASGKMPFDCKRMAYGGFEVLVDGARGQR